jgi:hypothetical protein
MDEDLRSIIWLVVPSSNIPLINVLMAVLINFNLMMDEWQVVQNMLKNVDQAIRKIP